MTKNTEDSQIYWDHMKILMEEYKCSHFLFNKLQVEYRKQRLQDEGVEFTDIFDAEDEEGPYLGLLDLRK